MSIKIFLLISFFILNLHAGERIISLSPSITEIIYGLGAGDELVATSSYSLYPKAAQKLPIIGGYTNPNIEKILSHHPTLVVGQTFNAQTLEKLGYFHIKTLKLKLKIIKDIENSILLLGQTISKTKQANKLITDITNSINKIKKSKKPHSVLIVYGLHEDLRSGIYIAGSDIFFDDIIKLTGNTNAYKDDAVSQPVLGYENIIALNPEQIIILHSHATEPNVNVQKALAAWYALPTAAARNKKISIVDEDYLHIPSQRVALTIKRLSREMLDD
ncbi:helical backbone metal receptor [Sulfurimonas paralvinellae]|uniref:ABC transporter substrate-binding protein n=1 Tax=Sulfurimonas paralvinellae TaxID=317658 RepID=A0A7M1B543_9BACT|nr:helical backbone metal receptor [Sulfurimonas paralvinellae]QOP44849.1 ABC transporter substrate-binding protein [Sulfurimonas paralvinellae]